MNFILSKVDPLIVDMMNLPVFPTAEHKLTLWMIVYLVGVTALLIKLGSMFRQTLLNHILPRFSKIDIGNQHSLASILSWFLMSVGFLVVLDTAGIDITIITVLAGAIGLGASMSLQNIATNIMSGIIILCERPIKVGDRVEVGNIVGTVVDITLRATSIVTNDNIAVIVPNADFVSSKVINWSYKDKSVRFRVALSVPKEADPDVVKNLLVSVAMEHPGVLKDPVPEVLLTGFGSNTTEFALLVWTHECASDPDKMQSDLNFKICRALKNADLQMPVAEGSISAAMEQIVKSAA